VCTSDLFPDRALVWTGWADAISDAVKCARRGGRCCGQAASSRRTLDEVNADGGWIFKKGAIDFAGGTVVHINSGIAGLVVALLVGQRVGSRQDLMAPHSLTMTMIGASMLWSYWFGFNAGSDLEANLAAPRSP